MNEWTPNSFEDRLLLNYHESVGGRLFTEVPVPWSGGHQEWSSGFKNRFIDAIRIPDVDSHGGIRKFANRGHEVLDHANDANVELIEIKSALNRPVIGQLIAGLDLFEAEYSPRNVTLIALCEESDPALEWVCARRDITVKHLVG